MTRILVVIPSRHRARSLEAVLRALQATESGENEVAYVVSYCRHDEQTQWAAEAAGATAIMRPDDCTPGAAFNHAVRCSSSADIYTGFCDDVFPLTWRWDEYLAHALAHPLVCFCWQEATDPVNASYIASSARVLHALGDLCPEYFPYWFTDLWLAEIHHMAFGARPDLVDGLRLVGKRGTTQGFRDFPLWCRVFTETRPERMRLAVRMAAEYGATPPNMPEVLAICKAFDADFLSKTERFTARFADPKPVESYYLKAKTKAERLLSDQGALINA